MPFLPPNQQRQSTEDTSTEGTENIYTIKGMLCTRIFYHNVNKFAAVLTVTGHIAAVIQRIALDHVGYSLYFTTVNGPGDASQTVWEASPGPLTV